MARRGRLAASEPGIEPGSLFDLRGRTAVVTGGNRGIGLMIADGLARAGASVIVLGRDRDAGARAIATMQGRARFVAADISSEEGARAAVRQIANLHIAVSILVNNAAVVTRRPLPETTGQDWDRVVDLNLKAPFYMVREMLPLLEKAATAGDPSRVINIGSIEGIRVSGLEVFPYSSSKAGLHHLTRAMARDLGRRHITVNAIAPGTFPTEMSAPSLARRRRELEDETALGRLGRAEDIVGAVTYLAGLGGSFVTGAIIPVDGGASMRW